LSGDLGHFKIYPEDSSRLEAQRGRRSSRGEKASLGQSVWIVGYRSRSYFHEARVVQAASTPQQTKYDVTVFGKRLVDLRSLNPSGNSNTVEVSKKKHD
jgi:hypothetical protein